jgi:hypothetical protein
LTAYKRKYKEKMNNQEIEDKCEKLVEELPEDHGKKHSETVAKTSGELLRPMITEYAPSVQALIMWLCYISALIHDLNDKKMEGYQERWQRCLVIIRTHPFANAIEWIVGHIGVSREAGPEYANKGWSAAEWERELETLGDVPTLTPAIVLMVRHCVSCADMLTALGREGNQRAVDYNTRKLEETGACDIAELRKRVRWVHASKHLNMLKWVHVDTEQVREMFAKGIEELIQAYNEWCLKNGGGKDELL